jgi:putative hydrolase of the HAD superfamily
MRMSDLLRLIFDADDTLWDNNIFYEEVRQQIFSLVRSCDYSADLAKSSYIEIESKAVRDYGYGTPVFLRILDEFCTRIIPQELRTEYMHIIENFRYRINRPRPVFPGVHDTLQYLSKRYELFLLTKGNTEEQRKKIHSSGLDKYFIKSFIEQEKNLDTLKRLLFENNWSKSELCMIGNSPKSDINPALRLGIKAIYIPYQHTWYLDDEPILPGGTLLRTITGFTDLKKIL